MKWQRLFERSLQLEPNSVAAVVGLGNARYLRGQQCQHSLVDASVHPSVIVDMLRSGHTHRESVASLLRHHTSVDSSDSPVSHTVGAIRARTVDDDVAAVAAIRSRRRRVGDGIADVGTVSASDKAAMEQHAKTSRSLSAGASSAGRQCGVVVVVLSVEGVCCVCLLARHVLEHVRCDGGCG